MRIVPILVFSISMFSIAAQAQEPEKLTALRSSWQRARDQATQPVDTKYKAALQQLLESLTKSGDLNAALAVRAELDKMTSAAATAGASAAKNPPATPAETKIKYRHELIADGCSYAKAVERAKEMGGIVAFPRDEKELKEFRQLADKVKVPQIWLGVAREALPDSKWICTDGNEFDPKLATKIGFQDDSHRNNLRLGDGSALNAHNKSASLPFIVAIPK